MQAMKHASEMISQALKPGQTSSEIQQSLQIKGLVSSKNLTISNCSVA